jgi:hypothetical protein
LHNVPLLHLVVASCKWATRWRIAATVVHFLLVQPLLEVRDEPTHERPTGSTDEPPGREPESRSTVPHIIMGGLLLSGLATLMIFGFGDSKLVLQKWAEGKSRYRR